MALDAEGAAGPTEYDDARFLAGALLFLYAERLIERALKQNTSMTSYGNVLDRSDHALALGWQKRAVEMVRADPKTEYGHHPLDDPRVLRLICETLLKFDHVKETMEE